MIGKYSLPNLLKEYQKNKHIVDAYIKGQSVEGFMMDSDGKNIMGATIGVFVGILLLSLGIWIWALVALISNWHRLDTWAQIIGLITLLTAVGGPVITLLIVYLARHK